MFKPRVGGADREDFRFCQTVPAGVLDPNRQFDIGLGRALMLALCSWCAWSSEAEETMLYLAKHSASRVVSDVLKISGIAVTGARWSSTIDDLISEGPGLMFAPGRYKVEVVWLALTRHGLVIPERRGEASCPRFRLP